MGFPWFNWHIPFVIPTTYKGQIPIAHFCSCWYLLRFHSRGSTSLKKLSDRPCAKGNVGGEFQKKLAIFDHPFLVWKCSFDVMYTFHIEINLSAAQFLFLSHNF